MKFTEALNVFPNYYDALNGRGAAYKQGGKFDDLAMQDYEKAIQMNPENGSAHYNKAFLLEEQNDFDGAIKSYTKAIAFNMNDDVSYFGRGSSYARKGEFENAIRD